MKKILSKKQIQDKKNELLKEFENSVNNLNKKRKTPTREFLRQIKNEIKQAIEMGLPYTQIAKEIKTVYNINISVSTIKNFVYTELDIKKKQNKDKISKKIENSTNNLKNTPKTSIKDFLKQTKNRLKQIIGINIPTQKEIIKK